MLQRIHPNLPTSCPVMSSATGANYAHLHYIHLWFHQAPLPHPRHWRHSVAMPWGDLRLSMPIYLPTTDVSVRSAFQFPGSSAVCPEHNMTITPASPVSPIKLVPGPVAVGAEQRHVQDYRRSAELLIAWTLDGRDGTLWLWTLNGHMEASQIAEEEQAAV